MTVVFLNSNKLGNGPDDILGEKLLVSFLKNLAATDVKIDVVGCVNSAVLLTTKEGEALEQLKKLEAKGTKIVSCKTCLDHYNLLDQLKIGGTGSMDQTVLVLSQAERVIYPC